MARAGSGRARYVSTSLSELLDRFAESAIENWTEEDWEGFAFANPLASLPLEGLKHVPPTSPPLSLPIRHSDLLLKATGASADALVHDRLIRFYVRRSSTKVSQAGRRQDATEASTARSVPSIASRPALPTVG